MSLTLLAGLFHELFLRYFQLMFYLIDFFKLFTKKHLAICKKTQNFPFPSLQVFFSKVFFIYQYRLAIPWNTYRSRKLASSQKQSIISVIIFVSPVSFIARRRILYAYFLMRARLFGIFRGWTVFPWMYHPTRGGVGSLLTNAFFYVS